MGRPPCCDKVGIKKGPWTPEEDIILVSYIQQHGPGNWRSVPTNTGLLRCSKSCRLRWTNYLRPGIKRGNFTAHEEGMIIHLQSLLGNKWAAIASYLPQRTDNDIKNYWNTHLKKKLKKFQSALDPQTMASNATLSTTRSFSDKSLLEFPDDHLQPQPPSSVKFRSSTSSSSSTTTYASSTENISRLLEGWMKNSPKTNINKTKTQLKQNQNKNSSPLHGGTDQMEQEQTENLIKYEDFESLLTFENMGGSHLSWEKSSSDSNFHGSQTTPSETISNKQTPPFSLLEKWLLDEATGLHVQEMIELSPIAADGHHHDHNFPNFL